jgi:16S rRNA (guanine527-N7)-methyltransferase
MSRPDLAADLCRLADRYDLAEPAADRLRRLLDLVASDPLAPTSVRDPGQVLADHIADSLVALELPALKAAANLVDMGSGAGFPGLVLAVARPGSEAALLEASARKCAFLERAVARCDVANARVVHARAEEWRQGLGGFAVATARALGPLEVVLEYAAPLLRVGGHLVVWRGRRDFEAEARAERAAGRLGLEMGEVRRVVPYPGAAHRHLHVLAKLSETPAGFPRRSGMARKRPLGASIDVPSDRARR